MEWVLRTDRVQSCLDIEFDCKIERHIITESGDQQFIVYTGFVYDEDVEGHEAGHLFETNF